MDSMTWLSEVRKIDAKLLGDMGVREVIHPAIGPAIAFPYFRGGESKAAKFRTVDKQFRSTQGVSRGLYNEDNLRFYKALPVVITEGEIDCLSCIQAGFERSVSVPDGWTEQGNKTDALIEAEATLRDSPYVIVAADGDKAGESLPRAVANLLRGHDVRHAVWPAGCKDPNDVLMRLGEGALASCLNAAVRIDPPGGTITGFSDLPPLSDRRVLRISDTPFRWVVALELGAMSVWTGTPGSGKSTFLIWAAERIAVEEDIRVGLLAFETHPHDIRDQLALIRTGNDWEHLDARARDNLEQVLDRQFRLVHVKVDEGEQHLKWLESMVFTLAVRDQCKLIIVDPWNELEHLPMPGESMTAYINYATKFIRQLAEKLDVHIALVAHPRKMPTDGKPRPPTGYDIAESAAFFNKPSLGVTIHQPEGEDAEPCVELHVWKVRKTRLYGFDRGRLQVRFNKDRMAYERVPK